MSETGEFVIYDVEDDTYHTGDGDWSRDRMLAKRYQDAVAAAAGLDDVDGDCLLRHILRVVPWAEYDPDEVRAKIAANKNRCAPDCPTWAVFDDGAGYTLQPCIDCWSGAPVVLTDEEVESLPEAQAELALANELGGAYVNAVAGPVCCELGYGLWRPDGVGMCLLRCVRCGKLRDPNVEIDVSDFASLERYLRDKGLRLHVGYDDGWWAEFAATPSGHAATRTKHLDILSAIKAAVVAQEK